MNKTDFHAAQTAQNKSTNKECLYIDAGVGHLRLRVIDASGSEIENEVLPSNRDVREVCAERNIIQRFGDGNEASIFITGKLSEVVRKSIGAGRTFFHAAVLWLAAREQCQILHAKSLAMLEISASGYTLIGVDEQGALKDDLLILNPRCGAGTGVNLDRVLQKLGIAREEVDVLLAEFIGEKGQDAREKLTTRADRCGVFGASATISDKNQGIPLAVALATTLKSETLKVCRKLPAGFESAVMLGRFFHWQFVRDCAEDYLKSIGVEKIIYDTENTLVLDALQHLLNKVGLSALQQIDRSLLSEEKLNEYPSFVALKNMYQQADDPRYHREANLQLAKIDVASLSQAPLHIGLDVGSTMAKVVIADDVGNPLLFDAYSNAGDTISTVKRVFSELKNQGFDSLQVRSIGITGSARYQVQEALSRIYPQLAARIAVLVENYAHARGSIDQVREHIKRLKSAGINDINEDFCILVDIGGEDTKISSLALKEAELFNNAMNLKCSAGTGSLMDTLSAIFGIAGAGEASALAMQAAKGYEINATCAVFLMENAQKLQAQGVERSEILASANWAIVENMARTLWSQLELPGNTVVVLHGQTMLSDPLPLAVIHRLQTHLGAAAYGLVPSFPGHRACLGLIRSLYRSSPEGAEHIVLDEFLDAQFEKRIIQCKGAACDDDEAVCNRTSLRCQGADGKKFTFTLGGCSAINELFAKAKDRKLKKSISIKQIASEDSVATTLEEIKDDVPVRDTYKEIWDFIDQHHPKTEDEQRLVIPRSFVISEWAYLLAKTFEQLGFSVHVDNVRDKDLTIAQPLFDIDSCAPHMGAVGQMERLASNPHGFILAPQIEKLPTQGKGNGITCTLNQGGIAVARGLAQTNHPDARIHLFRLDIYELDAGLIGDQIYDQLQGVFAYYAKKPTRQEVVSAVQSGINQHLKLRKETAELAADLIEETIANGHRIGLVVGREYLLNPGIYDSHVRRLLRDKQMAAIPSYVLDIDLNEDFRHIYWRNPQFITTILQAVAEKNLHQRVVQPRLAAIFKQMESGSDLLPIVQVSTFCCGPDSVTLPIGAEIMKKRPFLLIQSDAIIKELAHLENRVNTYVRQLDLKLHDRLALSDERNFEVRSLDSLENDKPIDPKLDVIYFPTLSDNRTLTSVLRGAGFACIDNYVNGFDLQKNIKRGRRAVGDTACAPMAGVYADLERACEDFATRQAAGDPLFVGKKRLLFFDNAGSGPCRQGQYIEVHKLSAHQEGLNDKSNSAGCSMGAESSMRFLVGKEENGYNFGLEEWTTLRMYQGLILQGVLHDMLMMGTQVCRNTEEFSNFEIEFNKLKDELYHVLEKTKEPSSFARSAVKIFGMPAKYFAYGFVRKDITSLLRDFSKRWIAGRKPTGKLLSIHITGEIYMRVALAEDLLRSLLSIVGFGRFSLNVAPLWSYLEYLIEEASANSQDRINQANGKIKRQGENAELKALIKTEQGKIKHFEQIFWVLRNLVAKPFYQAAALPIPTSIKNHLKAAQDILPTIHPVGELAPYLGEVLHGLRDGADLFLNVAPNGCMVSTMGQVFTPQIRALAKNGSPVSANLGRVQHLFSADGEINEELLSMALLKTMGPDAFFVHRLNG